jgi:hypothetical protein
MILYIPISLENQLTTFILTKGQENMPIIVPNRFRTSMHGQYFKQVFQRTITKI